MHIKLHISFEGLKKKLYGSKDAVVSELRMEGMSFFDFFSYTSLNSKCHLNFSRGWVTCTLIGCS